MIPFHYIARRADDPLRPADPRESWRGSCLASSASEARACLLRAGLVAISLTPQRRPRETNRFRRAPRPSRARIARKAELLASLAALLDAGFALSHALEVLDAAQQHRPRRAHRAVSRTAARAASLASLLRARVISGESLSAAAASEPRWFTPAEAEALRAAERGGSLAPVLRALASRLDRSALALSNLFTMLLYPAIVLILALAVAGVLGGVVLPRLAQTLTEAGLPTPALTRALIELSRLASTPAPWIAFSLIAILLALARAFAARRGRALPPPALVRDALLAEWTATLAHLLGCGLTLPAALRGGAQSLSGPWSAHCARWLIDLASRLEQGQTLTAALAPCRWLDSLASARLRAAASAGELAPALTLLASSRAESVRRRARRLGALIEPLVIVALALLVGVVVFAAIQPLARLNQIAGATP